MGIKILSLHMLPWYCFHLPSSSSATSTADVVRLIGSDGAVKVFRRAVSAAEVMRQHPLHLICRSDSLFIGQKVPPLSPSDRLRPGHSYFLLPSHFFRSVLSFVTLSSSLIIINNNSATTANALLLRSFDIRRTEKGMLQVRVKDADPTTFKGGDDGDVSKTTAATRPGICDSEGLEKEYRLLVGPRRHWKPRLETIAERKSRRIRSVMLLIGGGRTKQQQQN